MSLSYLVITYGCQMNAHDSEIVSGLLEDAGYVRAADPEAADVIVLNTCCVRENAEERVLGKLGELQRLRRVNRDLLLVVAGCFGQQPGAPERIRSRAALVDVVLGTHNLRRLPHLVEQAIRTRPERDGSPLVEVWPDPAPDDAAGRPAPRREGGVRAWVTIMLGCSNHCSYCIVPYVRGPERSRPAPEIRHEAEALVRAGYREVVLLGQNVNAYGKDVGSGETSFSVLLRDLSRVHGLARIRYTTSHPRDFSEDIIAAVAECPPVCENFHLPAQSGSNRILRMMNRGYSRDGYRRLIERIRARLPEACFSTDLIVGFPGETDQDFEETLSLVREVRFDSAFTFAYSPRSGTSAAGLPDQISDEVKRERLSRLIEVQKEISLALNRACVGKVASVLVEGAADKDPDQAAGRTRGHKLVVFRPPGGSSPVALTGHEIDVLIEDAQTWSLGGRAVGA